MIPGLVLVAIGALFLLDNLHIVHVSTWFAYWPVILIAIGLVKLVDSTHTGGHIAGGVLMAVGGLFLADNLGYLRIDPAVAADSHRHRTVPALEPPASRI